MKIKIVVVLVVSITFIYYFVQYIIKIVKILKTMNSDELFNLDKLIFELTEVSGSSSMDVLKVNPYLYILPLILLFLILPVFASMIYYMKTYQNFQYKENRRDLFIFGLALFSDFIGQMIKIYLTYYNIQKYNECNLDISIPDQKCYPTEERVIISVITNMYGVWFIIFSGVILYLKKTEDYIANFSQSNYQKIVSIHQRQISQDGKMD